MHEEGSLPFCLRDSAELLAPIKTIQLARFQKKQINEAGSHLLTKEKSNGKDINLKSRRREGSCLYCVDEGI